MSSPNPTYLILGATGGIGSTVCQKLAATGANLVVAARSKDAVERMAAQLNAVPFPLDATDFEQVQAAVKHTKSTFGRLDGVANCVGSILLKPAHLTSLEEFETTLSLNLRTAFYTVKAATRAMMSSGGSIVLCSSAVARTGLLNHEAIAAAKAGIVGLALSAAATYANRNIRINCVAPGLVDTPLAARILSTDAGRKQSEEMHALKRIGSADDVAHAIRWLLDPTESGWVTGQVIGVDGGLGTLRPR